MSAWSLLAVPLCLGVIVLLLAGMSWFEQRLLSPRSLIVYTARSRHMAPETVEQLVAAQSEALLRGRGVVKITTKAVAAANGAAAAVTSSGTVSAAATTTTAAAAASAAKASGQAAPAATRS
jgi:hypothetical protein